MKASQYLYIIPYDNVRTIIFCGTTRRFMRLNQESFESVALILKSPDNYNDSHPNLLKTLKSNGFVIDDDVNETDMLSLARNKYVNSPIYKTTILTTYDCNYKCWYCIQNHVKEKVSAEKIALIIKHVKTYLIENSIKEYILSWFGGEPLMEPEMIDTVSQELYKFCQQNNIVYCGAITTNGSLLTDKTIEILYKNHIDHYQITIDGDKENHDKTKNQEGEESSFETILNNIVALLNRNERAEISLRFNYTPKSLKSPTLVDDVNSIIPAPLRNRISVDFHKVWQIDEHIISIDELASMLMKFYKSGYKICSDHVFSICYVDKVHHNTIYYNGGVDKCDNHDIPHLRGYIDSDGHIIWKERPIINDVDVLAEGICCRDCHYYPVCYGCCPVKREEDIIKNGKMTCKYEGHFDIFEHRILDYCVREMISNDIEL